MSDFGTLDRVDLGAIVRLLETVPGSAFTLTLARRGTWSAKVIDASLVPIAEGRKATAEDAVRELVRMLTR